MNEGKCKVFIEIKNNVDDAISWLDSAIGEIEGDDLNPDELQRYLDSSPELKLMHARLHGVREQLKSIWTPALSEQLDREDEALADGEDASSY